MYVLSEKVRSLISITQKFGVCLPLNPRVTVGRDGLIGADTGAYHLQEDQSSGYGLITNVSHFI